MSAVHDMETLEAEFGEELHRHILPYWAKLADPLHGGFYGRVSGENALDAEAPKGAILNARILWTYSAAYRIHGLEAYREMADRAYGYLEDHFWDSGSGGVYWMLDHRGMPLDSKKHTYAQAFAMYGYSEYHRATGNPNSLSRAVTLFHLLDEHAFLPEQSAYYEAFDQTWNRLDDVRLSDIDAHEVRSTNTHLHILEAFANLYRAWPDAVLHARLTSLLRVFLKTVYDPSLRHFHAFFDDEWNTKTAVYSYGHDIEASWLLCDAALALGDQRLQQETADVALSVARATLDEAMHAGDGGVFNFGKGGSVVDTDRHWWAQAEAIVGFVNAYQIAGAPAFVDAALRVWEFVKAHVVDRADGEWYFRVDINGQPYHVEDKAGPWKCPYHTSRASLELTVRLEEIRCHVQHGAVNAVPVTPSNNRT